MARRKRSTGKIDRLPDELRDTVEQMLLSGSTYREIVAYLAEHEVTLSQMAVCNYARKYLASVEQLRLSQENMRIMMEELDKYPNLDAAEAILRIAGNNVFNSIAAMPEEGWDAISPEKLLKQATALARAAAYKKRVDQQLKSETETALDAGQALIADLLAKKHPELYEQLTRVIREEKERAKQEECV